MFFRILAFFALVAVAFANPKPDPQVVAYTAPAVVPAAYYTYTPGFVPTAYAAPVPYAYNYFIK